MARKDVDEGLQRFLQQAATHRLLSEHEEKALARRAVAGDERAREELLMCNIRLVVSIARHFRDRGLPFPDVIQDGIVGLNRATEKFDPERGFRFSTYATLWIKQAIQRGLSNHGSTIRLPPLVQDRRIKAQAMRRADPDITVEEIALKLEMELQHVLDALGAAEVVTSLDREVSDEDSYTLLDTMTDHFADDPQDIGGSAWLGRIESALDQLPKGQRNVIQLRFGLDGAPPRTWEEVAKQLKISTDKAKKDQRTALASLKEILEGE